MNIYLLAIAILPDPLSIRIFNSQKQRPDPTDAVVEPYVVADYL